MKLLVCGPRDWADGDFVNATLDQWFSEQPDLSCVVMHGGARGVDSLAGQWARSLFLTEQVFAADWDRFGKSAGYRRNRDMIDEQPDIVIAFRPSSGWTKGTGHTVRLAELCKIPLIEAVKP